MTTNKNCVSLNKEIVQELDYPAQVLITFNKETKVMGIQVCRAKSRVMNNNLKETLFNIMPEWEQGKRYNIEGIHIPEVKAFVFELSKFEELTDFIKNDSSVKN